MDKPAGQISDEEMAKMEAESKPHGWMSDADMAAHEAKFKVSPLESGLRGAAQGASMGFADEITGGLESAAGSLGLVPDKTYEQARDESRAAYQAAQTANPGTYLAGQVGGGVATMLVPGLNVAKGATALKTIGQTALQGGLTGLGSSEAKDFSGLAKDTGAGLATGAALGAVAPAAGAVINKVAPGAANAIAGASEGIKDVGGKALNAAGTMATGGSLAYGAVTGDWKPAGVVAAAKNAGGPAFAKAASATLDRLPDILRAAPQIFGKYAQPLLNAMQRGGSSLGAAHFVLQSSDPEYRELLNQITENGQ